MLKTYKFFRQIGIKEKPERFRVVVQKSSKGDWSINRFNARSYSLGFTISLHRVGLRDAITNSLYCYEYYHVWIEYE